MNNIYNYLILFTNYKCPFRKYFNFYCAGCGTMRMIKSILKLNFYQAFRYNPLMFIILFIFILYFFYVLVCKMLNIKYCKIGFRSLLILCIIMIVYTIMRNVSGFEFLQPIDI